MNTDWTPIRHTHLSDQVYKAVRDRILHRMIDIDKLVNVDEVASELGVSRTPVLDAIKRLAAEGLVDIKARRGTYVKCIAEKDVIELFQMREALEVFAARHAISSAKLPETIARMEVYLDIMAREITPPTFKKYAEFSTADDAFHHALIDACENTRMQSSYANLHIHMHIMRAQSFKNLQPSHRVHADHIDMLDALRARDSEWAEHIIKEHLLSIKERMIINIRESGGYL